MKQFFIIVLLIVGVFYAQFEASAVLMNASDLIGHVDENGDPVYTRGGENDSPNPSSVNGASDSVVDTVHHRLFTTDSRYRVLVYNLNADNTIPDHDADYVLGQEDLYSSVSGVVNQSSVQSQSKLAYDSVNDRLFVAGGTRVLVFDVATIVNGENAVNVLGQEDFVSEVSEVSQDGFGSVEGLAFDSSTNRLFVSDLSNSRVLVFDVTTITDGEDAINVLGQVDFVSNGWAVTQSRFASYSQYGLALDPLGQRLFVSDSNNSRVLVFDVVAITDGENAVNVLGQTDFVSSGSVLSQSGFGNPKELEFDGNSRLFVSDGSRVLVFDVVAITDGENAVNVLGQTDFVSSGGVTSQSGLQEVSGLGYNPSTNRLLVSNYSRISVFDVVAITDGENAIDLFGHTDDDGNLLYTKSSDHLNNRVLDVWKGNITVDSVRHRLFLSDTDNNRILVFNLNANNELIDHEADYVLGHSDFYGTQAVGPDNVNSVSHIVYDSGNDRLFVSDTNRVLVFDTTTITNGENAVNVLGQPDFTTTNSATTQNGLNSPSDMVLDDSNNILYVADESNERIMIFDVATITDGENAVNVLGQPDFITRAIKQAETFVRPRNLALDESGRLFVNDSPADRVLVFDVATITDGENAVNVLGQPDFVSAPSAVGQNTFINIRGLAYDSISKSLFMADYSSNLVLVFDVTTITDGENAINVIGQEDFISSTPGLSQSRLDAPNAIGFDELSNTLYVADTDNGRVMIFKLPRPDASFPEGMVGVAYSEELPIGNGIAPYSVSLTAGTLPAGLTLAADGTISGTPTTAEVATFTIIVTDSAYTAPETRGFSGTREMTLTIAASGGDGGGGGGSSSQGSRRSVSQITPAVVLPNLIENRAERIDALLKQVAVLQAELQKLRTAPSLALAKTSVCPFVWNRTLISGATGDDVHKLQQFLNTNPATLVATSGDGAAGFETAYYGPATLRAVQKFQEYYRADILTPASLQAPTGFFGVLTMKKLNALCAVSG